MYVDTHAIVARWPTHGDLVKNWGDKLNRELILRLSGSPVVNAKHVHGWGDRPVYRVIGSGLGRTNSNEIIWGSGFIDREEIPLAAPAQIYAVRGPLSRDRLLELGIFCPEVYGDPAVLYPLLYWPSFEKKHRIGIIQHFREFGQIPPVHIAGEDDVLHIDICGRIREVVDAILSCELIISSSLHGVICAHSYGIPAHWLKSSDLPAGDDFKFHDYYASIGHRNISPAIIDESGSLRAENNPATPGESLIDVEKLINSCPFMSPSRKQDWVRRRNRLIALERRGTIFR